MEAPRLQRRRGALHHGGHRRPTETLMLMLLELTGIAITAFVHVVRAIRRA